MLKIILILLLVISPAWSAQKVGTFGAPNSSGTAPLEVDSDRKLNIASDATLLIMGNVGIGTIDTSSKLDVVGSIETDSNIYFGNPTTDGTWAIRRSGNNLIFDRRESGVYVTKATMEN